MKVLALVDNHIVGNSGILAMVGWDSDPQPTYLPRLPLASSLPRPLIRQSTLGSSSLLCEALSLAVPSGQYLPDARSQVGPLLPAIIRPCVLSTLVTACNGPFLRVCPQKLRAGREAPSHCASNTGQRRWAQSGPFAPPCLHPITAPSLQGACSGLTCRPGLGAEDELWGTTPGPVRSFP